MRSPILSGWSRPSTHRACLGNPAIQHYELDGTADPRIAPQQSEIFLPAPFSPKLEPRQLGNLYEIRIYTFKPGGIPAVIDRWSTRIADRIKLSPLVGAWYSELGGLNKWCHIWAYKDAADRFRIREEARAKGIWPPPSGGGPRMMIKQENMLVVPASFSPLR